jgi:hypothetical protein
MMESNKDKPAFGIKGYLGSGDLVVKKPGPSKVIKKWGKAAAKKRGKK